jgi:IS5 family transposase
VLFSSVNAEIDTKNWLKRSKKIRMKPKSTPYQKQGHFFYQDLLKQLNPKDPLLLLAQNIPWEMFERDFSTLYAECGRPAKPN